MWFALQGYRWARSRRFSRLGVDLLHNCLFSFLHNAAVSEWKIRLWNVLLVADSTADLHTSWLNRTREYVCDSVSLGFRGPWDIWASPTFICKSKQDIGFNTDLRSCSTAEIWSRPSPHGSVRCVHPWRNWLLFVGHQVKIYLLVISLFTLLHWLIHKLINIAALHT